MNDIGKLFIALRVKDARKSAEFYKQLGFTPEDEASWHDGYAAFSYQGTNIALMDFIPHEVMLLNLEQSDQAGVEKLRTKLEGDGLPIQAAGAEGKGFYFEDPDGNGFYVFTEVEST